MKININRTVKVQLTNRGKAVLLKNWRKTQTLFFFPYIPPIEDEEGWSKHQLWDLMSIFGSEINAGCRDPLFKNNIILIEEKEFEANNGK